MKRNNKKRNSNRNHHSSGGELARMSYTRSSMMEQMTKQTFPSKISKISVAAAAIFSFSRNISFPIDALDTDAANLVGKYNAWRIVSVTIRFVPLSQTPGSSVFFFADKPGISPSNFKAHNYKVFPNNSSCSPGYSWTWKPNDMNALNFHTTSVSITEPLYNLYGYTNTTDLGTPVSTADLWAITGHVVIEARGLGL